MDRAKQFSAFLILWLGMAATSSGQTQAVASTSPQLSPAQTLASAVIATAGVPLPYKPPSQCNALGSAILYGAGGKEDTGKVQFTISATGTMSTTVTSNGIASSVKYRASSGTATVGRNPPVKLPLRTALLSQRLYLPSIELAEILNDPNSAISVVGPSTLGGKNVYSITVTGHWSNLGLDPSALAPSVTYQIDASSLMILSRQDVVLDPRNNNKQYTRLFKYADYRTVGPVQLPYTVTESFQGTTVVSTTWNTLTVAF